MPSTRAARSCRRVATKRTILSALDENNVSVDPNIPSNTSKDTFLKDDTMNSLLVPPQRPFCIPKDLDCTASESINILLEDISREVKSRQESVAIKCCEALKRQHEAFFLKGMKIEKSIKKMKIKDFNQKFMKRNSNSNGNNIDGENSKSTACIIAMLKSFMSESDSSKNSSISALSKKRFRDDLPDLNRMELETPIRQLKTAGNLRTPATILRTAKRGEVLMSANGSPIEQCEEGDLVATVSKRRRPNGIGGIPGEAMFDINVGGEVISLSDPNSMSNLSNQMKSTVTAQLNVLQDQISRLMTQIES